MSERRDILLRWSPVLACAVVLVWHSLQYNFVTDDAYISFVFSRNLAEHGELVFNVGAEPVEGYTNFLWTFLLGILMVVRLPPEIMSLVLGTGFGIATLAVSFLFAEHILGRRTPWAYVAPALLAMSSGFACWSSGGLETQMFTFFVTLGLYAYVRGDEDGPWLRRAGWILALAALTRPEGMLVAGLVGVHRLAWNLARARRVVPTRDELWCLGGFLVIWAPWYAWRWWYYGYPFPNTYYVKAAGDPPPEYREQVISNGLYYVKQWLMQTGLVYAAPVVVGGLAVADPRGRRFYAGTLLLLVAGVYLAYTVRVGGDFMGLHRFIMPVFVIAALGMALGLAALTALAPSAWRRLASVAVAVAVLGAFGYGQLQLTIESLRWGNFANDRGIDTPAFLAVYAHDRAVIGEHMRDCFDDGDFAIYGGAGAKPYYARAPGIDVFGLVSERIAHEVAPSRPRAGHTKWGPDPLLFEYEPTFVFSCYRIHGSPHAPPLPCGGFWRRKGYEQVTLHIPGLLERGEYYTFLVRRDRAFRCEGQVAP